ncbi:hypothetical protein [uncultured Novosphingobium sp.]|uniref:hypothetical protein n=1 Tax=uncultured Novosphingobium sp. TaxID=292277 RepID=UPI0025968057|nr:hypothetical protein [uncultured Novosphingobium sp.]
MTPYRVKDSVIDFRNVTQIIATESRYTLIPKAICGLVIVAGIYSAVYLAALGYTTFQEIHDFSSFLSRALILFLLVMAFFTSLAVIAASAGIIGNMQSDGDTKWVLWLFGLCIAALFLFGAVSAWTIVKMTSGQGPVPTEIMEQSRQGLLAIVLMILLFILASLSMSLLQRKTIRISTGSERQNISLVTAQDAEKLLAAYMAYRKETA